MSRCFLRTLTLSHFRSHRLCRLECDGRPVVLYGPNGAGKTNVLEAVSLLSPGRGLRRATADDLARRPEALGWKVAAVLDDNGRAQEIETRTGAGPGQSRAVRIDTKPAPQAALGRVVRILWLAPHMDRLWSEGAEGRRRFLDRMTLSFEPAHAEAMLVYEKAMRERNRLLKDQVSDAHWYRALETRMAEAGAQIAASRRRAVAALLAAQDGASGAFPAAQISIAGPEGEDGDGAESAGALREAFARSRPRDMAAGGRTLVGPHRIDLAAEYTAKGVRARDCSTGEQKALLISLVLANARALKGRLGAAPILLLDEVAAHLDADRCSALHAEITALGSQAWMTGTGAEPFTALGGGAQYFRVTETGGASAVHPATGPG